ncbi:arginine decarboxylase, partial [Cribrihabitans sp. XS_ASV171]
MKHPTDAPHSIYGVEKWGKGLIEVTEGGEIGLRNPRAPEAPAISLPGILHDLEERGIRSPMILRVASYLENEIRHINESFAAAIARTGYKGAYRGVFPIKVNQQAQVIDRIVEFGAPFHHGLEAGSKPELVIALAHRLSRESLIVCNGIKDAKFI